MDDELSTFEHVLLKAHLAVCRDCRRFAADVRWQTESVRAAPRERLSRPVTIPSRRSWRRPALGMSTAAVVASIVALAVGLRGPATTHAPAQAPRVNRGLPAFSAGDTAGVRRGGGPADQVDNVLHGDPNAP